MTYTANTPQSSDDPSVSQGQLLTNFQQLDTVFGNNHVAYSAASDNGKHKFCQFTEQGADPATAANELAIYTKDTGTRPDLFYRGESSGSVYRMTGGGVTAAAYCSFVGTTGVVSANSFNVTNVTRAGVGTYTVNFTRNFNSANYVALVDVNISGAFVNYLVTDRGKGAAGFSFLVKTSAGPLIDPPNIDVVFFGVLA